MNEVRGLGARVGEYEKYTNFFYLVEVMGLLNVNFI
jgi:hypothetical protein